MILLQEYVVSYLMSVTPYSHSDLHQRHHQTTSSSSSSHVLEDYEPNSDFGIYADGWVSGPPETDDNSYQSLDMKSENEKHQLETAGLGCQKHELGVDDARPDG